MKDPTWPALTLGLDAVLGHSLNPEAALERVRAAVYRCRRCPLYRSKTNYVFGAGNPRSPVVFVGEAPGAEEDRLGKPFVGRAGERLTHALASLGWTREEHVYIANTLKCRPPNNRDPRPEEIQACSPFLDAQIRIIQPRVLVALGLAFGLFYLAMAALHVSAAASRWRASVPPLLKDNALPVYTVLVPLYREAAVLGQLLQALARLDYPAERLDIKLLVEEDDEETLAALRGFVLPRHMEVLVVPRGAPRTKPRALNHGLACARGELLTIYDAEEVPHPGQLRVAASCFAVQGADMACLQAPLGWYNATSSFFSRMLAVYYAAHFHVILPWLHKLGLPLPLGGTSNHFRVAALREAGAWDPFNVTEDADLGLRLAR
ncbi:MAG: glycosyltransferase, partial [Candidatus Hydrothermae bacterium]|nr:glycosyltransferase [Candidatus Hydrothermae bacterium]